MVASIGGIILVYTYVNVYYVYNKQTDLKS